MTCREFAVDGAVRAEDHLARAERAVANLEDVDWNQADKGEWSPAQIFEHMRLGNAPYLSAIAESLDGAPIGANEPVRTTWFGRTIRRMSGPSSNAPVPKPMVPRPGPYALASFGEWRTQQEQLIALLHQAQDRNIAKAKMRNPFIRVLSQTLCDSFGILLDHTERHLSQVEARVKGLRS